MSLSRSIYIALKSVGAFFGVALILSACSFSPVYGDKSLSSTQLELFYAEPNTRLEQIVYSDLKLRLGESNTASSRLLKVAISQSVRTVGRSSTGLPASIKEVKLVGTISVLDVNDPETTIYSGSRSATATYSTSGQVVADRQAADNAAEIAALELAQTIRLTLIGALGN